jgi:hypothetical protein
MRKHVLRIFIPPTPLNKGGGEAGGMFRVLAPIVAERVARPIISCLLSVMVRPIGSTAAWGFTSNLCAKRSGSGAGS